VRQPVRILLLLAAVAPGPLDAETSPIVHAEGSDAAMNAAVEAARGSLELFLSRVIGAEGAVHPGAMLKAALPTPEGQVAGVEHIWVFPFRPDGAGGFTGELFNAPVYLPGAAAGDTVSFGADQVSDWAFFGPDGLLYGGYSLRAIYARHPEMLEQAMPMSGDPIPAQW
jgi:uncharacterized protein YegJ (DUF2314 family)